MSVWCSNLKYHSVTRLKSLGSLPYALIYILGGISWESMVDNQLISIIEDEDKGRTRGYFVGEEIHFIHCISSQLHIEI